MKRVAFSALFLAWWAVVGFLLIGGVFAVFTVGPVLLLAGAVVAAPLVFLRSSWRWMGGALLGPGLLMLTTTWASRDGPGIRCSTSDVQVETQHGTVTTVQHMCGEIPSPWVELSIAMVLIGGAVAMFLFAAWVRTQTRAAAPPPHLPRR